MCKAEFAGDDAPHAVCKVVFFAGDDPPDAVYSVISQWPTATAREHVQHCRRGWDAP